jgi:hypothetical protein
MVHHSGLERPRKKGNGINVGLLQAKCLCRSLFFARRSDPIFVAELMEKAWSYHSFVLHGQFDSAYRISI